jgi:hypothetical protein
VGELADVVLAEGIQQLPGQEQDRHQNEGQRHLPGAVLLLQHRPDQ